VYLKALRNQGFYILKWNLGVIRHKDRRTGKSAPKAHPPLAENLVGCTKKVL
jgi:hypothetical protein